MSTVQNEIKNDTMSWTPEELQKWWEAGLIPKELFDPNNYIQLIEYLRKHKKMLYECYRRNPDEDKYTMKIPPQSEWGNAPDITVIDRKTGEVVSVLEQARTFELCEGICFTIRAKELNEWETETAGAKKLDKEQHVTLTKLFKNFGPEKQLTRQEIVQMIEEVRKPKRKLRKYRQAGHLVDQKLSCKNQDPQLSLFDSLSPETKKKIEESRLEVTAEGIRLTYTENKLIHALNLLLCEKSQNSDPKADNFYSGNAPSELVYYGAANQQAIAPVLKFKPAELYKAFMGSDEYSGADIKFIKNVIVQLESKKVLIKYDRVKKVKEGSTVKTLTDRIEDFQPLIRVISFIPDLSGDEKAALDAGDSAIRESRGEIIIALNPIFRDQIDTKYIEFPEDTNRRLVIAAGGHKMVTAGMQALMEYMLREMSNGRYDPQLNEDTLVRVLGMGKYMKEKRKKLLSERIDKDIQAIINMGIIQSVEKKSNSTGGMKWVFHLNKEYE